MKIERLELAQQARMTQRNQADPQPKCGSTIHHHPRAPGTLYPQIPNNSQWLLKSRALSSPTQIGSKLCTNCQNNL